MKVLVAGSSGLVGTALVGALAREGHRVVRLLRPGSSIRKDTGSKGVGNAATQIIEVSWNPTTCDLEGAPFGTDQSKAEGADVVVNLAGASIAQGPWTEERKALLRSSRVRTTRELVCALEKMTARPKVFLCASAVGYYGNRGDEVLTEDSKPGEDFLARLTQEWEAEAVKAEALGIRVVRPRFGIILDKDRGALPEMIRPFRFGVGGRLGSGEQWMSWVSLPDVVAILRYLIDRSDLHGAVNIVSPEPVRNAEFSKTLARVIRRPALFPAPAFMLRLILGEMADALLLASQRTVPTRLQQLGYRFLHPELTAALDTVLAA